MANPRAVKIGSWSEFGRLDVRQRAAHLRRPGALRRRGRNPLVDRLVRLEGRAEGIRSAVLAEPAHKRLVAADAPVPIPALRGAGRGHAQLSLRPIPDGDVVAGEAPDEQRVELGLAVKGG